MLFEKLSKKDNRKLIIGFFYVKVMIILVRVQCGWILKKWDRRKFGYK